MITFQKAKAEEALEIKKLLRITWNMAYSEILSSEQIDDITSEWHKVEFLQEQIRDPKILFLVVKDGDTIIGMCNTDTVETDVINVQRIHVLPNYQGKGIGTKTIDEVINAFPKAKKLQLEVEEQNNPARIFYEKRGFKKIGQKTFEVKGVKMPSFIMEKTM